jgi:signal transduction histidine kinase
MLATLEAEPASHSPLPEPILEADLEAELEPEIELEDALEPEPRPAPAVTTPRAEPGIRELLAPLAQDIRKPLRAVRTYASLVEQRPNDAAVRHELSKLVEEDLGGVDETLQRVERFVRFGPPNPRPFELAPALAAELDARSSISRARELVVLRELDFEAPPLVADEAQIRFAVSALLDRALRLVPRGGDVYLGSAWNRKRDERPAGHRILLRFHSPEDVLASPLDGSDGFVEVVMARELFARAGGTFAIDASGPQDNVILVELPG